MKYISLQQQLLKERQKTMALNAKLEEQQAKIDYLAMMTDVTLDEEEETE